MTNEVENVPELRFPEFKGEWESQKLKNKIVSIETGTNLLGSEDGQGIPLIKMGNIKRGYFSFDKLEKLNKDANIDKKNIAKKGDFLFNTRNTMELVGKSATWTKKNAEYAFNSNIARLVFNDINTYFFNYLYNTPIMINKIRSLAVGTTSVAAIYPRDLKHLNFYLPTLREQKKIGDFFSKLDQQIELEEKKLAKLEEQKKGYMQKLFSQELRFKDENGDDYPEWMETSIRNIFDNKGGTALEKEFDNNGTHKVISIGSYSMNSTYNEQNLRINKNDFTEKYLLNEGDLAMVLNDKTKEGNIIGRSIYIDEDDKYIYNQRTERLIPVTGNNHKFLWYLMNSEQFRKKIKQMMQGATQVYINYNSIKDLSIYLPILEEQNKIENFLGDIFNIIKNQSDKVELLKRRKKGFLQKMFV